MGMLLTFNMLDLLIWVPIMGGVSLLFMGDQGPVAVRRIALLISIAVFLLSLGLWCDFDSATAAMQFVQKEPWIEVFHVYYSLGIDGISLPLIVLTAFSTLLVIVAGWSVIQYKVYQYYAAFLIMEGLMIGVFCALDGFLFYVFWEAMLVPMFLIIGIWGGPNKVYATLKLFLYTFFGSVFMLIALIYLYHQAESFSVLDFHRVPLTLHEQIWIFLAFLIAFAVKVPMWPVHTWLPDAHVEAPTGGSVILAAIMLKIGGYGFLRFSLPIAPDASHELSSLMILLSLVAVVYIGFVALVQEDMKKLIAYSSIAHMGFVTLGIFVVFPIAGKTGHTQDGILAIEGGMVQMISHGFISGALFLCVGVLYDRLHSRAIKDYRGVASSMPIFAVFMVFFALANSGLPGTSGFVGEFMVILGSFKGHYLYSLLAATTLMLGAAYSLWLVKRVIFGIPNTQVVTFPDLNGREFFTLGVSLAAVLVMGLWPDPLIHLMHTSMDNLLIHIGNSKL